MFLIINVLPDIHKDKKQREAMLLLQNKGVSSSNKTNNYKINVINEIDMEEVLDNDLRATAMFDINGSHSS
jgi:hypothetical protein